MHQLLPQVLDRLQAYIDQAGARGLIKKGAKPAMMGYAGIGAARGVLGRRRSGLDKTVGRPTGMYNY